MEDATFSARTKKNNFDYCSVRDCNSKASEDLELRFHIFPIQNERVVNIINSFGKLEQVDKLKAWKIALKIHKISSNTKVCSRHFKKSDYILPDIESKKRRLKNIAVPSCNLPGTTKKKMEANQSRLERRLKRSAATTTAAAAAESSSSSSSSSSISTSTITETIVDNPLSEINSVEVNIDMHEDHQMNNEYQNTEYDKELEIESLIKKSISGPSFKNVEVQVNATDIEKPKFCDGIKTDSELSTATGIESFQVLNTILKIAAYVNSGNERNMKMTLKERVIMTFVKLKQNLSYSFLALIFKGYSAKHCQRIFYDTVKMLSFSLKAAIPWPSRDEIRRNIPECFESFEDVRVVLDCTEVFIQRPGELCCQILTYSHYKSAQTCKIMTGVSPAGNITFVSKPYGGRVTDTTIFQQSDLIHLLEPGDAIMVDRGFLIDEICRMNRWKCVRPPFLKDKKQFDKEESVFTAKIAKARVHVERSNQRIKTFKILGSVMPVALVPIIEDIFTVICATINMSSPILSDSKFMKM